jgi:3-oxoacyl-[acyl-carrier protein] reductase
LTSLTPRIALVTGASQGIGRACALALAAQGAHIALAARTVSKLEEVAAEIVAAGGTAHPFALDVADETSIKSCAKSVIEHFGRVDILVNNAGITRDILALRMKRADWDDVLTTNLTGAFLLTQACIGVTKSLARELASRNITVNAVAPGYIETAMTAVLTEAQRTAMTQHIPLGRVGLDTDIAHAVAFLASDGAAYITGHTLDVNGGMYMG